MKELEQLYLCEQPKQSEPYDSYVRAWEAYRDAAAAIDGHIGIPSTHKEMELTYRAGRAGQKALQNMLADRHISYRYAIGDKMFQVAKMEVARKKENNK